MTIPNPPQGVARFFWRLPIWLYRLNLGWLLGKRMLLINHVGRKSGLPRQAVVEIVRHDPATNSYTVCSGFGKQANWYRNLQAQPHVTIQVGRQTIPVTANFLSPTASGEEMVSYAKRNPRVAQSLMKLIGHDVPTSPEGYRRLAKQHLPFVTFTPRNP